MTEVTLEIASQILEFNLEQNKPTFLWGAVGVGKSSIVHQVAKRRQEALGKDKKFGMIDFRAILRDPVDLRGLPAVAGDKAKWLVPDDLPQVERDGEEGILFMDELNAAPPSMQAACFGLVLDRKVGNYTLPPGWRIVAAGNRLSDRAAAQKMPSALANRFSHIDVVHDVDTFVKYGLDVGIPPQMLAFVRFRPALLHKMNGDDKAFPTPRSLEQAAKSISAPKAIRLHTLSGDIGDNAAGELEGFLRVYEALPSIESVISNPNTAKVPSGDEISARYAIVSALAAKADKSNFDNIMLYANRMPREFATMLIVDATRRDNTLTHTAAFVQWAKDNADVTM